MDLVDSHFQSSYQSQHCGRLTPAASRSSSSCLRRRSIGERRRESHRYSPLPSTAMVTPSSKAERARANVAAAGLVDLVEIRVGVARETLKSGVGGDIDLVMLDGAFTLYLSILKLLEPHLKPGTLIIGENAFEEASGYVGYVRDPKNGYVSVPLPFESWRGNEFTVKTT
jgi:Methyltransferase domain